MENIAHDNEQESRTRASMAQLMMKDRHPLHHCYLLHHLYVRKVVRRSLSPEDASIVQDDITVPKNLVEEKEPQHFQPRRD